MQTRVNYVALEHQNALWPAAGRAWGATGLMLLAGLRLLSSLSDRHKAQAFQPFTASNPKRHASFTPQAGIGSVLVRPQGPGPFQLLHPNTTHGNKALSSLFFYEPTLPSELAQDAAMEEAWVYGVRVYEESGDGAKVAIPTGDSNDILKGRLLSWSEAVFPARLKAADMFHDLDPKEHPQRWRGVAPAVRKDGTSVQAYWYYGMLAKSRLPRKSGKDLREMAEFVQYYHQRSKHSFQQFSPSTGMDWSTQPDPFRRYVGATVYNLPPLKSPDHTLPYQDLYRSSAGPAKEISVESLSHLLYHSLALSAWKMAGPSKWALRVNPSSGNLHPTEGYLILPPLAGLNAQSAGVYHYAPKLHALEQRAELPKALYDRLVEKLPPGAVLLALTSIPWREMWKYGYRSFRYCNHDIGHAMASVHFGAKLQGWDSAHLVGVGSQEIDALLGLDRAADFEAYAEEPEFGEALMVLAPAKALTSASKSKAFSYRLPESVDAAAVKWHGVANTLSPGHANVWPDVVKMYRATHTKHPYVPQLPPAESSSSPPTHLAGKKPSSLSAGAVIRRRRSAVDMDGVTSLPRASFLDIMSHLLPGSASSPFTSLLPLAPAVHLGIFVHRVEGLVPGLYALIRDAAFLAEAKQLMRHEFVWQQVESGLPLYLLAGVDPTELKQAAMRVSCNQDIAADGSFSLGMFATWQSVLQGPRTPAAYRQLYWETGMIGQILYLEAEAHQVSGTGIGCFFDDGVHTLFLRDPHATQLQSLYHFTVGGKVEDTRVQQLDPYEALLQDRKIDNWA
eukprot:g61750.t1